MSKTYPTISVRQPWAGLLALSIKDVENRTWRIPQQYIGKTILIHAGKQVDTSVVNKSDQNPILSAAIWIAKQHGLGEGATEFLADVYPDVFKTGGIVGRGKIISCINNNSSRWANPEPRTWHWAFTKAHPLKHFECKGALGIFQAAYPYTEELQEASKYA